LEATLRESDGQSTTVINDVFGNVVGTVSGTNGLWNPARVSSYGPEPGYQALTLSASVPLVETLVWRTRRVDPTGYYWLGARYYDPVAGRMLSPDPLGHAASMSLYDLCNGDPLNRFDADGRDPLDWADHLDAYVSTARGFYTSQSGWFWNGAVGTGSDVLYGVSDMLRLGTGVESATRSGASGWDIAIGVTEDIARAAGLVTLVGDPATGLGRRFEPKSLDVRPFGELSGTLPPGEQAHHSNQNGAFASEVPRNEGASIPMRGDAMNEPRTSHYEAHSELERFWDQFREGGPRPGEAPTIQEYSAANYNALRQAGYSASEARQIADAGLRDLSARGFQPSDAVPRVPNRFNQAPDNLTPLTAALQVNQGDRRVEQDPTGKYVKGGN
jgi:RHS repeat-associated protein